MKTSSGYDIRAEFKDGSKRDFHVPQLVRTEALRSAEAEIVGMMEFMKGKEKLGQFPPKIEWHGMVAFVNCVPAENSVRTKV